MSADNWTFCPKCNETENERAAMASEAAANAYGKVSAEEYMKMLKVAKCRPQEQDLREDYEIGIDGDFLKVSYCCSCNRCGFSFAHSDAINVVSPVATAEGEP